MTRLRILSICSCLLLLFTACNTEQRIPSPTQTPIIIQVTHIVEATRIVTVTREIQITTTPIPTPASPAKYTVGKLTGVYSNISGEDNHGCVLNILEKNVLQPLDIIDFELGCNRGAPSFTMGFIQGTMNTDGKVASFTQKLFEQSEELCVIIFQFHDNSVEMSQTGFECGFGFGVYAVGSLSKTSNVNTKFGCLVPYKKEGCP